MGKQISFLEKPGKDLMGSLARYTNESRKIEQIFLRKMEFVPLAAYAAAALKQPGLAPLETGAIEDAALKQARKTLAKRGFSEKDLALAEELLAGGGVFKDLAQIGSATARALGRFPQSICDGFKQDSMKEVVDHVRVNLLHLPGAIAGAGKSLLASLKSDGEVQITPSQYTQLDFILADTLNIGPADVVRDWAVEMLGIPSVRAAIIIYARGYNVEVSEEEIDAMREALEAGTLAPLLAAAMERYQQEKGAVKGD